MNPWTYLAIAIALEVVGTSLLKLSNGFENGIYGMASLALYSLSFWFLAIALKVVPVGVAYAIWSGLGTVLVVIVGLVFFAETMTVAKAACFGLIIAGCVGLNLLSVSGAQA